MIEKKELRIKGLHCVDCVDKIERTMKPIKGIHYIKLSFATSKMEVKYEPNKITLEEIHSKIKSHSLMKFIYKEIQTA